MKKFKTWIKYKLREFLGIDNLESNFKDHETFNNIRFRDIEKNISHCQEGINTLHTTIENVVHIGTDVRCNEREHSWAVICIEGKINIVKFVELNRKDGRYVLDFLKQFEASRHCIETPYKEMFYDGLFKF